MPEEMPCETNTVRVVARRIAFEAHETALGVERRGDALELVRRDGRDHLVAALAITREELRDLWALGRDGAEIRAGSIPVGPGGLSITLDPDGQAALVREVPAHRIVARLGLDPGELQRELSDIAQLALASMQPYGSQTPAAPGASPPGAEGGGGDAFRRPPSSSPQEPDAG